MWYHALKYITPKRTFKYKFDHFECIFFISLVQGMYNCFIITSIKAVTFKKKNPMFWAHYLYSLLHHCASSYQHPTKSSNSILPPISTTILEKIRKGEFVNFDLLLPNNVPSETRNVLTMSLDTSDTSRGTQSPRWSSINNK